MEHSRIQSQPSVMMGKPVIRGTRVTVEAILRKLAAGWTIEDVLSAYPHIERNDVLGAMDFAADHLEHVTVWAAE